MNLFVCGSIKIKDKEWIFSKIEECIAEKNFTNVTILEGEARGVDLIAKEWALAHDIPVKEYPPDMQHYLHKEACHKRMEKFKLKLADGPRELLNDIWDEAMKIRGRYTY